jgi:Fe-S-cluster-containing hydrogenase component 2
MNAEALRELCLESGADDVGLVAIDRPEVAAERTEIEGLLPGASLLLSFVVRMNREPIRTPARSIANLEFHHTGDRVDEIARRIVTALERRGIRALNPSMGFPMEVQHFPGKIWTVSHKRVAEAAGLGRMGIHRNLIHPRFGNFVLLGTIVVADLAAETESKPLDFNPCVECKLCVAACPVGAVKSDGGFDFSACYTHNYREFMGGFTDWVETVVESGTANAYREKVTDAETASLWQSLSFGANYKAAYCLSVCPAGDEILPIYELDKQGHLKRIVKPLQEKQETVYVVRGSDAEAHVRKRFPHKTPKHVRGSLRPTTIAGLLAGMPFAFQRTAARGLDAVFHFTFTGREHQDTTLTIKDERLAITRGHAGEPDVAVVADSDTWLGYLAGRRSMLWAVLTRRVRVRGKLSLLEAFERCFPR